MSKTECDYLDCGATNTLIVQYEYLEARWGLCAPHESLIQQKGAKMVAAFDTDHHGRYYLTTRE